MLYRIWPLFKEVYHYEKHLVMFANTALIFMGLLLLVWNENDGFQNLWFFLMPATLFVQSGRDGRPNRCGPPRVCRTCVRPTVRGSHVRNAH